MEKLEKSLLSKVVYEEGVDVGYNFNFLGTEFSDIEREYLNENYEVIGTRHTESGLDLVIFKNLVTGENTISIAGTNPRTMADWVNDYSLGATGIAHRQFIELYNYYQQITHAYGENILQIKRLENSFYEPEKPYLRIEVAEEQYTYYCLEMVENNDLPLHEFVAIDINNLTFTGHSLGGHLAGIMSIVTGKEAIIFNAPAYKENTTFTSGCEYVRTDGSIEKTTSDFDALIGKLLNIDNPVSHEGKITHYQNGYGGGFDEIIAGSWNNTKKIYCLSGDTNWFNEHSINQICTSYYAYETIKDIVTAPISFYQENSLTSFQETFENVYKAYCLNKGKDYYNLDYSKYADMNKIISDINEWILIQQEKGIGIKIDSYNHTASLDVKGTTEADIIYTGGGDDTVDAKEGDDVVYGYDYYNPEAPSNYTKNINLGSGSDTYYGGEGNDIVDGGNGVDSSNDTNTINLGNGNNEYHGGAGNDNITGGNGIDIIYAGDGVNIIDVGSGNNEMHGGNAFNSFRSGADNDTVWSYNTTDSISLGAGNNTIYLEDNKSVEWEGRGRIYVSQLEERLILNF